MDDSSGMVAPKRPHNFGKHKPNATEVLPDGSMRLFLNLGASVVVDAAGYEIIKSHRWWLEENNGKCYAKSYRYVDGKRRSLLMHNLLITVGSGMVCDHIDGDGLNNRRSNLREVTPRQNAQTKRIRKTSKYTGVSLKKSIGMWQAAVRYEKHTYHLGYFRTEESAFEAYCAKSAELGEPVLTEFAINPNRIQSSPQAQEVTR